MKKILALAAVAALTAGVSAYAANPFSDVTPSDWAYQAVVDLSEQGVVEGYPDGTFKGERNITRYEMAQIIARMLAKEDQLNAEQRATLDKLAGEYADELANLGVRVSNLEKKVGNIYWSGDARMRYQSKSLDQKDGWNGRIRINVKGQVNDSTYVQGRFLNEMDFKGNDTSSTSMDQLYVNHNFGKDVSVRLGRQPISFGDQAGWLNNGHDGYDGGQIAYNNGKLSLATGYGQFNSTFGDFAYDANDNNKSDFYFARGAYDFNFAKLGVDYIAYQDKHNVVEEGKINAAGEKAKVNFEGTKPELFGVNLNIPVQQFNVFGEYWKNTTAPSALEDTAWNAGLSYGAANWKKPGTWDLSVAYNSVGNGVYLGATGWQTNILDAVANAKQLKFWNAMGDVTLAKNVQLHAEYAFAADADQGADPDDAWTVSLNYKF
ncbi:S-layer homology domain-containing protein [uncultured Dialister sp.]|uniref:S-layer homology domain-containing protein n=1 Tax=uncultured Dialister sp. TaxID=278064 RepID=UPI00265FF766|nr:S-layer homology domain-containing protein [uncultured Dialister sp.]